MRRVTVFSHLVLVCGLSMSFAAARAQDTGQQQEASQPKATNQPEVAPAPQTDVLATATPTAVPSADDSTDAAKDASDPGTDPAPAADTDQHHPMTGWPETGWPETAAPKPATPEIVAPASVETPAKPEPAVTPAVVPEAPPQPAKPTFTIGSDVRDLLPKAREGVDQSAETKAVSAVYASRRDDAIWVTPTGLNAKGQSAIAEIKLAADWGLEPGDYVLPSLPDAASNTTELPRDKLADAEMKISFAVLGYARDARGGRITEPSKQLSSYLDRQPQVVEPRIILEQLAEADNPGDVLRKLNPQHPQFERLRQKYLEMRSKAASAKDVVRLPASGPKLTPGIKHPDVAILRQRLGVTLASGADADVYDPALEDAVKAYQTKQGQKPDGIVGKGTRTALGDIEVPDPKRLLANMEEWRWMPADLGEKYVTVNIPEFMVRVVESGKVTFEERIVSGQVEKQTPIFSDQLETIYFHPRWNVPESIKVLELYPNLARGGGSFQRQGLKLMRNGREISPSSVDWSQADIRNFDVFQPSGESNVLGLVKFAFPNKHGVYMHDTSAKGLFEEPSRPFSHGCMRVRNPLRLAEKLLSIDKGWPASKVSETLDSSPDEVPVQIDTKIPVHITYFTDVIDDNGEEHIFKDVYGHEQRIKLALAGRFNEINIGPDHLAPVAFHRDIYASSPDDWGNIFGGSYNSGETEYSDKSKKPSLGNFLQSVFGGFDSPAPTTRRKRSAH